MIGARPVTRGCGTRVQGGIYLEVGCGAADKERSEPIEYFLLDPPYPGADFWAGLGITAVGVHPYTDPQTGVTHVIDWVGESFYPNVLDFVEEARRFGISRRISTTFDFSLLGPCSRLILLHPRAGILNAAEMQLAVLQADEAHVRCPKRRPEHDSLLYRDVCAGLWWHDVEGGTPHDGDFQAAPCVLWNHTETVDQGNSRLVRRKMPSFEYAALVRPDWLRTQAELAAFASLPLTRIVVVTDPDGGTHQEALVKARKAELIVEEVDE